MTTIKLRRGTSAQWTSVNPVLAAGEPGLDTTVGRMKIGDGVAPWSDLEFITWDSETLTAQLVPKEDRALVRDNVVFPGRKVITVDGRDFYIKGVNLGLNGASFFESWTSLWDGPRFHEALDNIAKAGFNTVRIIGHFRAYLDAPERYKTRMHGLFEKARSLGLKVIYEFLCNATAPHDLVNWYMYIDSYKAMFTDLTEGYIGDPMVLAWGVGNELHAAGEAPVASMMEIIRNFAPWIKSQDPDTYVTASQAIAGLYEEAFEKIAATDPYVDLHAIHVYLSPSTVHFGRDAFQAWCDATKKPVYINEFGANTGASAGGPWIGGKDAQASFLRMFRRHVAESDLNGVIFWKAFNNPASQARMGLWDDDDTPTPQLDEAMRFPDRRISGVREAIDHRPHPVLSDTFDRAPSADTIGPTTVGKVTPEVVTSGTAAGIRADGGLYISAKNGSTSDKIVWDCGTARNCPLFEAEFVAPTADTIVGLLWDWTDATNFMFLRFVQMSGFPKNNQIVVGRMVNGTQTDYGNAYTLPGLADAAYPRRVRLSIRLIQDGSKRWLYPAAYGIALPRLDISNGPAPSTKRGVLFPSVSDGWLASIRSYEEGRVAP
ncbi:cellulase family glycosylhydrolase [Nocardioides sp. zg-ZUI104]|uniref:hyaluronate lyase N-terminal domain-containing protein n=1 Tax=Nocardioides faecalis TaxID=2803858 RepID=UPI001BCF02FB|nr:cellulase family glycosylhydrolase [Nocardioides faecalis]MBS4753290.1 cellulase family glycosylhydrolase [Nocardioides faecalis]